MEEGDKKQRYTCKFCNKIFVTGKSLGGHMRCHLALISAQKAQEIDNGDCFQQTHKKFTEKPAQDEENKNDNGDGYGLRENPKKSWRASGLKPNAVKENENDKNYKCKECGKGFLSMRALSGHMRCHSIKLKEESTCKKCGKEFDSIRALFGHMRSHSKRSITTSVSNESAEIEIKLDYVPPFAIPKKRLRTRYKVTCSSSSVVTDTNEVEEVAMCLMMLSRDMKNWDDFSSVKSDNDSVNLEGQSLIKNWEDYDCANGEEKEKMNSCVLGPNVLIVKNFSEFHLFDYGSAIDGENKIEAGTSVNDSISSDKIKNQKMGVEFTNDIGFGSNGQEGDKEEIANGLIVKNFSEFRLFDSGSAIDGENKNGAGSSVNDSINSDKIKNLKMGVEFTNDIGFGSNQADSNLMKLNSSNEPNFNSHHLDLRETSLELVTRIQTNRLSNFEANFEVEKNLQYNENHVDEETSQVKNMFDLNVPLSLEDGAASDVGFKPWWVEGDREYEQLVIFN